MILGDFNLILNVLSGVFKFNFEVMVLINIVITAYYIINSKFKLEKTNLLIFCNILFLIVVGFINVKNLNRIALRDIVMLFFSFSLLYNGYIFGKKEDNNIFYKVCLITTIYHLSIVFYNISNNLNLYQLSTKIFVNYFSIYLYILLDLRKKTKKNLVLKSIAILSMFLSFSRVILIYLGIYFLKKINIKQIFNQRTIITAVILIFMTVIVFNLEISVINNFVFKFKNSMIEISTKEFKTMKDIIHNWRAYENYRVMKAFEEGHFKNWLFGFGWGSTIDIVHKVKLGGVIFTSIPFTHNLYYTILFKTGIMGLFLIFLYFLTLYKKTKSKKGSKNYRYSIIAGSLVIGLVINSIVVSNLFTTGYFEVTFVLGYFLSKLKK